MRAFVRDRYGEPDVLELVDLPTPAVAADGVLVRVVAASVNAADLDYLRGKPWLTKLGTGLRTPRDRRLGLDAAGVVEAVGPAVTRFRPGDAVLGDLTVHGYGAFGELVAAPESAWVAKPATLPFAVAATLPQSGVLALQALRGGQGIRPGSRVLVNGAGGNVGPFVVQLARSFGATVTGVDRHDKLDLVGAVGADDALDGERDDYTRLGRRWDWVVDVVGNRSIVENRRALARGGRYVMVGGPAGRIVGGLVLGPLVTLGGSRTMGLMMWWKPGDPAAMQVLLDLAVARTLAPALDRTYPLEDVPDALRRLAAGQVRGKAVIAVSAEP